MNQIAYDIPKVKNHAVLIFQDILSPDPLQNILKKFTNFHLFRTHQLVGNLQPANKSISKQHSLTLSDYLLVSCMAKVVVVHTNKNTSMARVVISIVTKGQSDRDLGSSSSLKTFISYICKYVAKPG